MTHSSSAWHQRILGHFTADLSLLWVACDPDGVLLDETLLSELRAHGFEVMGYDDPFAFRAEFEERYRAAWDANEPAPSPALIVHLRRDGAGDLPWDILHHARPAVILRGWYERQSDGDRRQWLSLDGHRKCELDQHQVRDDRHRRWYRHLPGGGQ